MKRTLMMLSLVMAFSLTTQASVSDANSLTSQQLENYFFTIPWDDPSSDEELAKLAKDESPLGKAYYGLALKIRNKGTNSKINKELENSLIENSKEWAINEAEKGNPYAQTILCMFNKNENKEKTTERFEKAAEGGSALAQFSVATRYLDGVDGTKNEEKGMTLLQESAEKGCTVAQMILGGIYLDKIKLSQDAKKKLNLPNYKKAFEWFRRVESQGNYIAYVELSQMYFDGKGTPKDEKKSEEYIQKLIDKKIFAEVGDGANSKWLQRAAELGYAPAQHKVGFREAVRENAPTDMLWKAAKQGYEQSMRALGQLLLKEKNNSSKKQAAKLYEEVAIATGFAFDQVKIALLYKDGIGVSQDFVKAMKWLQKAAVQDSADAYKAQYHLGSMYENGQGSERNFFKAVEWYKESADHENKDAQYRLGLMYKMGRGVSLDYQKAAEWLEKAANNEYATAAQYHLGLLYKEGGKGVSQDYGNAAKWLEKASEYGYGIDERHAAQYELALMYRYGLGVKQDYEKAVELLTSSAESGNSDAQFNLGIMYETARGVDQNRYVARKWFQKAADQRHHGALKKMSINSKNKIGVS